MKTKLLLSALLSFSFYLLSSQIPQGFNYQALASDASGNPIRNTDLQVKMSILSDTLVQTIVWEELHSVVRTDPRGVFSLVIGSGERQPASSAAAFSEIDWSARELFIKTQIYYQSAWKNMGSAKLWSVPYAMVSGNLGGSVKKLEVNGETTNMDEALFEVRNKGGQTVFAVYNEGVRVYVDDGAKGVKGGFSIGGFGSAKGVSQEYFVVNADSIRAYIFDDPLVKSVKGGFSIGGFNSAKGVTNYYMVISPDSSRIYISKAPSTKGKKGGFAIGGFDVTKAPNEEYLHITQDSTRIYVKEPAKGVKGGLYIGGFNATKGTVTAFTSLTPDNYFIGQGSGARNIKGLYNSFLGFETGSNNVDGSNNVFLGYQAGYLNSVGGSNVFLGNTAGYNNDANNNVLLGFESGYANTGGTTDAFMGYRAGRSNTTG